MARDEDEELLALWNRPRKKPGGAQARRARETTPLAPADARNLSSRENRKGMYFRFPVAFVSRLSSLSLQHDLPKTAIVEEAVNEWASRKART